MPVVPVVFGAQDVGFSILTAGIVIVLVSMILAFLSGMSVLRRITLNLAIVSVAVITTYLIGLLAKTSLGDFSLSHGFHFLWLTFTSVFRAIPTNHGRDRNTLSLGAKAINFLEYYATRYDTVELDGLWYRLPTLPAVERWIEQTPDHFVFSPKAHREITHFKRLRPEAIPFLQTNGRTPGSVGTVSRSWDRSFFSCRPISSGTMID